MSRSNLCEPHDEPKNKGKCRMKMAPGRYRGLLLFRCVRESHKHPALIRPSGETSKFMSQDDWLVDPDGLHDLLVGGK